MNIPQIDQDIATIKAILVQVDNGYHLSTQDYNRYLDAIIALQTQFLKVKQYYHKEEK